jgi:hypothetical protein
VKFVELSFKTRPLKVKIMSEERGSSKVRAFMGQTPKNLKQKFFSVLGTSSEYKKQFISGISNKVRVLQVQIEEYLFEHSIYFGYIISALRVFSDIFKSIIVLRRSCVGVERSLSEY